MPARHARTAGEAAHAAADLGFPVVLKVLSADILHKSDIGGVRPGVADRGAAETAFDDILAATRTEQPDAAIDGCLVAPMVMGGVETILGVQRDPVFGPIVMFGSGGIFVEALKDVTFRTAPFGEPEARAMIEEIAAFSVLTGPPRPALRRPWRPVYGCKPPTRPSAGGQAVEIAVLAHVSSTMKRSPKRVANARRTWSQSSGGARQSCLRRRSAR